MELRPGEAPSSALGSGAPPTFPNPLQCQFCTITRERAGEAGQ